MHIHAVFCVLIAKVRLSMRHDVALPRDVTWHCHEWYLHETWNLHEMET